jgi:hypothetical protein
VNNVKIENEQAKGPEPIELLDCGQASKVTKGLPLLWLYEFTPPPCDTAMIM